MTAMLLDFGGGAVKSSQTGKTVHVYTNLTNTEVMCQLQFYAQDYGPAKSNTNEQKPRSSACLNIFM